jgi:CubicO group peptidase (beta-lactamase class C family)
MPYVPDHMDGFDELVAAQRFSGVVRVDRAGAVVLERACGFADRAHDVAATVDTQIGIASASKAFTALTVVRLCELGVLDLATTARSLLGDDLPLIDDAVTIEQLLSHRSGIGDYLDEDEQADVNDPILDVPVHRLATTDGFLPVLAGHQMMAPPGERFAYCNGGFVVLALLLERATGRTFHDLVDEHVFEPAGMRHTAYLRLDELPGTAAVGYLEPDGLRSSVLHLPVRGNGDGGAFTTAADLRTFWTAVCAGRIVSPTWADEMTRPRRNDESSPNDYGLGFWLRPAGGVVEIEGYDAGASSRSLHRPGDDLTCTVLSNTTNGAWPITKWLEEQLGL